MYLAILYAADINSGETLTMSREVDTDDVSIIYPYLKSEAQVTDDQVDTILLIEPQDPPHVKKFWAARGGDFEGL